MKKIVVFSVVFLFFPVFTYSQNAVSLDMTLKNSTNYLNDRIPAKSKVVVLNFSSAWPQLSDYIIEELIGYIVNEGALTVVDRANLETIRQEMNFQLSGEVSDETAQSIGKKLGAQIIISGSITAVGNSYRLRIRAISVETAQIIGMQNLDVVQDSRLAALTGTAFVGSTSTTTIPNTSQAAQSSNLILLSDCRWRVETGGANATLKNKTTANFTVGKEYIEGQEKEVLTLEVNLASGNGYRLGQFILENETIIQKLKRSSGVRFKVLGDGKNWRLLIPTTEADNDYCYYEATFSTRQGRIVTIDIPYSNLKQPSGWGKRVAFNKNSIMNLMLQRNSSNESGTSVIKVFDFEIY